MAKVVATQRGYYGRILREEGETFSIPDDVMSDRKLRPSWVRPVKGVEPGVGVQPVAEPVNDGAGAASAVDLDAMTVKDLRALARERGIGIPASATTKADVIAILKDGEGSGGQEPFSDAPPPSSVVNEVNQTLGVNQPDWVQPGTEI